MKLIVELFPWISVAEYSTVVVPKANVDPEAMSTDSEATSQLSVMDGASHVTTASQTSASVDTVMSWICSMVGFSSSLTVMVKLSLSSFPTASVAV